MGCVLDFVGGVLASIKRGHVGKTRGILIVVDLLSGVWENSPSSVGLLGRTSDDEIFVLDFLSAVFPSLAIASLLAVTFFTECVFSIGADVLDDADAFLLEKICENSSSWAGLLDMTSDDDEIS